MFFMTETNVKPYMNFNKKKKKSKTGHGGRSL